jgi:orotidine-5'-phosphate decarboxylase
LCDFKIADIPNISRLIVEEAIHAGASGIICHGFAGEDSVRACVEAAKGADVFVVTELSHPGGQEYTAKLAEDFAQLAVRAGAAGIIAPATRPDRVKALRSIVGSRLILAPGVGAQGGKAAEAIAAGADAVIVGRAIYEAKDPAKAAREITNEIRSVLPR